MQRIALHVISLVEGLHDAPRAAVVDEGVTDWLGLHRLALRQLLASILGRVRILLRVVRRLATDENGSRLLERHGRREALHQLVPMITFHRLTVVDGLGRQREGLGGD